MSDSEDGTRDTSPVSPPSAEALAALLSLSDAVDPLDILGGPEDESRNDLGTREGESPPGESDAPTLILTPDEKLLLESELSDLLDRHDAAMAERWEQDQEIRDNYSMVPDAQFGGVSADSSHLASEATMMLTDQMAARLSNAITHAKPLIRVDPVFGTPHEIEDIADEARRTQRFMNEYLLREVDLRHLLPPTLLRTTKIGQSVWYIDWDEERRIRFHYTRDSSTAKRVEKKVGRVRVRLIDNRHVKVWPPTLSNWQRDYIFVGHEEFYTKGEWLALADKFHLSETARKLVESDPGEETPESLASSQRDGIDKSQMQDQPLLSPEVMVTQLSCNMVIPGRHESERFYVFYHRPTRQILFADHNPYHCQKHGYFPIPYKIGENSAWATGIGHEALWSHAVDTALRNLDLDNLKAGAYWVVLRKAGSVYNTNSEPLRPGAEIVVDDVEADFKPIQLGGEAPGIYKAKQENDYRLRLATKMAPVLSGQGDPTMKSGAGTGSTLALIEQANVSIRYIENLIHVHLSEAFTFILELIAQYATDGLFYRFADEADASKLKYMRYVPPRGDLSELFHLRVEAPSAATSDEIRRQSYMLVWTFALQQVEVMNAQVLPLLQAENPAAIPRYQHMVVDFIQAIARRVIEHAEVPDVPALIPGVPPPTPQDEVINQLYQMLQQVQGEKQQLEAQVQQMIAPPDPTGMMGGGQEMGMGGGMAPEMGGEQMGGMEPGMAAPPMPSAAPTNGGLPA